MSDVLLFFITSSAVACFLAPRTFRIADSLVARHRFINMPHRGALQVNTKPPSETSVDSFFDAMARSIRSHAPARDALMSHVDLLPRTPLWQCFIELMGGNSTLVSALGQLRATHDENASLLVLAYSANNFNPTALEHAAHIVRSRRRLQQSLVAATAQARLTVRILTLLPCVVLFFGVVFSSSLQRVITSPALLCLIAIGLFLNRCGAWWIARTIKRVIHIHNLPQSVALVDAFCVAVQSGHSIVDACLCWEFINPCGARIAHALRSGASLSDALRELTDSQVHFDSLVAHTLNSAHLDGLPVHSTATSLAAEARKTQQSLTDARIQQLPTRLSLPLVLCVLPSFGLLVLAPLLIAHLSQFGPVLPSPIS